MHVDFTLTEDDFVSAGKLFLKVRPRTLYRRYSTPVLMYFVAVVNCIALVSIFLDTRHDGSLGLRLWLTATKGAWCIGLLVLVASAKLLPAWSIRRQFRKNTLLHQPRHLSADDSGLHIVTAVSDSRLSWAVFLFLAENDQVFILVQEGGQVFYPLAKTGFSPDQAEAFRALVSDHLPSRLSSSGSRQRA